MLDHKALNAALADLAQYGWVMLETLEDAQQVRKAVPHRTKLTAIGDARPTPIYKVELTMPDPLSHHQETPKRIAAARAAVSHVLALLFLTAVGVGIAWLLLWLMRIV